MKLSISGLNANRLIENATAVAGAPRAKMSRPMSVGIVLLLVLGVTAGCAESEPPAAQEFTFNTCALLETATVEALIGEIDSQEEPVHWDGMSRGALLTCDYYPVDTSRSALTIIIAPSYNKSIAGLMENATGCDESMPLEVDGAVGFLCADQMTGGRRVPTLEAAWGEDPIYRTSIHFVIDREGKTIAEIEAPMQEAVKDLMKNVDEDSFTLQPSTP